MLVCLFFKYYLWLFHDVIYGIKPMGIQAFMAACACAICKHLWTSSMCAMFQACIWLHILSQYGWHEQMFLKVVASRPQQSSTVSSGKTVCSSATRTFAVCQSSASARVLQILIIVFATLRTSVHGCTRESGNPASIKC